MLVPGTVTLACGLAGGRCQSRCVSAFPGLWLVARCVCEPFCAACFLRAWLLAELLSTSQVVSSHRSALGAPPKCTSLLGEQTRPPSASPTLGDSTHPWEGGLGTGTHFLLGEDFLLEKGPAQSLSVILVRSAHPTVLETSPRAAQADQLREGMSLLCLRPRSLCLFRVPTRPLGLQPLWMA